MLYFYFELTLVDITVVPQLQYPKPCSILERFCNWKGPSRCIIMYVSLEANKLLNANMCLHIEHAFQLFHHRYFIAIWNDLEMTREHGLGHRLEQSIVYVHARVK